MYVFSFVVGDYIFLWGRNKKKTKSQSQLDLFIYVQLC